MLLNKNKKTEWTHGIGCSERVPKRVIIWKAGNVSILLVFVMPIINTFEGIHNFGKGERAFCLFVSLNRWLCVCVCVHTVHTSPYKFYIAFRFHFTNFRAFISRSRFVSQHFSSYCLRLHTLYTFLMNPYYRMRLKDY